MEARANPPSSDYIPADLLELSQEFSDFYGFNSDISYELQRLEAICDSKLQQRAREERDCEPPRFGLEDIHDEVGGVDSTEIIEIASPEEVEPTVRLCAETLMTSVVPIYSKWAATTKLRLLAKRGSDFHELIASTGAIHALNPLLRSTSPVSQENAITALLNLSMEESNKVPITAGEVIKPLMYALRIVTSTAKQNTACALLSLSMNEDNRITIGVCGAIPPLVLLMVNGSSRGKNDALTTLYKL